MEKKQGPVPVVSCGNTAFIFDLDQFVTEDIMPVNEKEVDAFSVMTMKSFCHLCCSRYNTMCNPPGLPSITVGLNMAEALARAPSWACTTPQLPVNTHRLEELAFKQSRQLMHVTPPMPKSSAFNSSDKSKPPEDCRCH
ncbi:hypothetical protein VitviT2T_030189 [Vitis vinifera]|uniref:Uncharacterized protein n=1 Tax=Vitis vinifera TaxID=29760 RepID=A0ABY9DZT2_VITVI|nr:hypothetical protein VitviT2T_030189 [Vitis vinifera]